MNLKNISYLCKQNDIIMKKYIIFIMLLISVIATAKKKEYIPGEPWPENGYDLSYYAALHKFTVQRFIDNDTLYYLKIQLHAKDKPNDFYFMTIDKPTVDSLLICTLTTQKFQKLRQKFHWMYEFKQKINTDAVLNDRLYTDVSKTQWTFCSLKKNQTFNTKTAEMAYTLQRTPKKKKKMTFDEWNYFYENMRAALKLLGGGTESKTLYDKVMQDGGY